MPIFRGRRHVSSIIRPSLFLSPQPFYAFFPRFPSIIKMLPERQFSSWSYICLAFFFLFILVLRIWNTFFFTGFVLFGTLALLPSFYSAAEWLFIRLRREICAGAFWLTATTAVLIKVATPHHRAPPSRAPPLMIVAPTTHISDLFNCVSEALSFLGTYLSWLHLPGFFGPEFSNPTARRGFFWISFVSLRALENIFLLYLRTVLQLKQTLEFVSKYLSS